MDSVANLGARTSERRPSAHAIKRVFKPSATQMIFPYTCSFWQDRACAIRVLPVEQHFLQRLLDFRMDHHAGTSAKQLWREPGSDGQDLIRCRASEFRHRFFNILDRHIPAALLRQFNLAEIGFGAEAADSLMALAYKSDV
jgi:hypothetical protein